MKSTTMTAQEAIEAIGAMKSQEEISSFIEGEDRKTVINAAEERRKALPPSQPKEGEVKGPITQRTSDFKGGVQGAKTYVTCDDVLKAMRSKGKKI
jgi:hypothetical protein